MSTTPERLRHLHNLHLRLRDMRGGAEEGGRKLRKFQVKIDLVQKQLADAQEAVKHLKVTIHEKEVTMKENEQKIKKHQEQLNQASSTKEYQALRSEIDHERQANRVLEDEILEVMAELEDKTKLLPALEKTVQEAKGENQKAETDVAGSRLGLEQRLAESQAALKEAEEQLPSDVRALYGRLVQARGGDALAGVEGRTCSGCYTEITPQGYNDLRAGRLVACKSCGRLLYLPEGV